MRSSGIAGRNETIIIITILLCSSSGRGRNKTFVIVIKVVLSPRHEGGQTESQQYFFKHSKPQIITIAFANITFKHAFCKSSCVKITKYALFFAF